MQETKIRLPQKGGAEKAARIFQDTRKKEPSDKLVKIISEIPESEGSGKIPEKDRAAKDAEL